MIGMRLVLFPPQYESRHCDNRRKMKAAVMATFQSCRAVIIFIKAIRCYQSGSIQLIGKIPPCLRFPVDDAG